MIKKPARGVKGEILRTINDEFFFRVYNEENKEEYIDYDINIFDMTVEIQDDYIALYESADRENADKNTNIIDYHRDKTKPDIRTMIVLVGLPGSGKSTLGNKLWEEKGGIRANWVFCDDLSSNCGLDVLDVMLESNRNMIVSDVFLCKKKNRETLIKRVLHEHPNYDIEFVYFENSPDKCLKNVKHRQELGDDRKVERFILHESKEYEIPFDARPLTIWQSAE